MGKHWCFLKDGVYDLSIETKNLSLTRYISSSSKATIKIDHPSTTQDRTYSRSFVSSVW
jgi:hypothetical protein